MKKIIIMAGVLTAGIMSANNNLPISENEITSAQEVVTNLVQTNTLENKLMIEQVCVVFHATCTSAYSCWAEDTPMERVYEWADNIQNNYCMIDSPFQP